MADEQTNLNLLTDFYFPIRDQEKIFSSNAYKVLSDNNIDTAELLGVTQNPNSHSIQLRNDADPSFKDKAKENAKDFTQGLVNFISDIPNEMQMKSVEGVMQAGKLGVNLMPILNKLAGSPFDENTVMDKAILWNKSINDKLTQFRDIYKQGYQIAEGRDPNGLAEFAGWIAQDYPYSAGIYKGLKQVGVSDSAALILSVGLGSAISFDPKETSVSLNLFTQEIASIKKYLDIIPDTPNSELFDRTVQLFEGTALAKAIPVLFDTAKFLKKNIPSFVPGAAVATAASTAIGEVTDQTILNPKEEITPQTTDGLNQNQSMLNTIKSGVDQFGNKLTEIGGAIKKEFSGEAMANPLVSKGVNELAPKLAPVFKSAVVDAVEKIPNKAPGNQILGTIKNIQGVTQQEMKWIGLDDFLKDKPSVTKQEVSDFIQANKIDVTEVQLKGSTNLPKELLERKKIFEEKITTGNESYPNSFISYDTYNVDIDRSGGFMDFKTLNQILGDNPNINNFKKLPNGNLTGTDNINVGTFEIPPIDFEKYQIENDVRKFLATQNKSKFERFTEPGGEDYTELVFKIAGNEMPIIAKIQNSLGVTPTTFDKKITTPYSSSDRHFGQKNEFAHVRFKSRYDGGLKILSVEEMQSDIANQFQKNELATNWGSKVLDFPFKNNWYEFVIKRLTRYAADNNFDAIAIPKASVPAKRYGESINEVTNLKIDVSKKPKGTAYYNPLSSATEVNPTNDKYFFNVAFQDPQLKTVKYETFEQQDILKILDNYKVRKDIKDDVENILAGKKEIDNTLEFSTIPVEKKIIGEGAGKYELYDNVIPSYLKKYAKKWNAKVYDESLDKFDYKLPVTILKLTPEMKRSVQDKSQPLFNIVLPALSAGGGAKVISDSIGNNTISEPTKNQ
jgi:hypothetical protein